MTGSIRLPAIGDSLLRSSESACPAIPFYVLFPFVFIPRPIPLSPDATPAERLGCILDLLCQAIAARGAGGVLTLPLLLLLWRRLRRIGVRATKVAARIAAGLSPAASRPGPRSHPAAPRSPRPPALRLPGGYGWLVPLVPGAPAYAGQLQHLLADPQMAPLLAAPSLRRGLNPICRTLGIPAPPKTPLSPPASEADAAGRDVPGIAAVDRPGRRIPVVARSAGGAESEAPVPPPAPVAA